jgi:tRNA nucleotidyltransferase/poly(A) polymerase
MIAIDKYDIIKLFAKIFNSLGISAYLVGGAVRDLLLDINPLDFDFVGEIDEQRHFDVAREISQRLNCSYDYNKNYHTAKFNYRGNDIDFVMARKEYYDGIAAKPRVYSSCLFDDLKRRDYTVNSMAVSLDQSRGCEIIDPFNGRNDLENKIIKVLHDKSFRDDPTRVFRGIKYAGRFGFNFDEETSDLIVDCVNNNYISYLRAERIKQEIFNILAEASSIKSFDFIEKYNILDKLIKSNVKINLDINKQIFNKLDNNRKLVVLLYKNDLETLNKIKSVLNLGNSIIEYSYKLKDIGKVLNSNDKDVYTYIFKNQNNIDERIVSTIFYKDTRLQNYFKYRGKIKIDKKRLSYVDKTQIEELILNKKLSMFNIYLSGGNKDDEF